MADPFTLMITQAALGGVSAFAQMSAANRNARAQYEANERNMRFLAEDVARQKDEQASQYQEARSDRVMRANQEIAMAELLAAERGASASTMQSMVRHLAFVEGIDLSRIRNTYESNIDALDSQLEAGAMEQNNLNIQAYNKASTATTGALLGGIGSGLQIYSGYRTDQARLEASRNKR